MRQPIPNCIRDNASVWFGWRRGLRERFGLLCFFFLILGALALLASPAWATVTLVQSRSNGGGGQNFQTVTLTASTTAGNLLIVGVFYASGGTSPVMNVCDGTASNCTAPNAGCTGQTSTDTFTALPNMPVNAGVRQTYLAYAKASSALTSFTACGNAGGHSMQIAVYEYNSTTGWQSSPLDTSATNTGATAPGSGGNITPSASGELIFSVISIQNNGLTITISGTGMTEQPTSNGTAHTGWVEGGIAFQSDGCDDENSGNTSTTCSFGGSANATWGAIIAAFKPAAGATIQRKGQTIIGTLLPPGEGQVN
jgi:hypothetical protein